MIALLLIGCRGAPEPAPEQLACGFDAPIENCMQACERAEQNACAEVAQRYALGEGGVERDPKKADEWFDRACGGGNAMACYSLAVQAGLEDDAARMGQLLTRSCDQGFAQACDALAHEIEAGAVPGELDRVVELQKRGCADNVAVACLWLGDMSVLGRGLPKDAATAADFYRKACHPHAPAQCGGIGLRLASRPVVASPEEVVSAAVDGCAAGRGSDCVRAAVYAEAGYGGAPPVDPGQPSGMLEVVCTAAPTPGCKPLDDEYRPPESLLLPPRRSPSPDTDPR